MSAIFKDKFNIISINLQKRKQKYGRIFERNRQAHLLLRRA